MALLAVLALSRTRSSSREHLMALLWPECDTTHARHLLRESLYRLRDTLGNSALLGVGDEIRLDASAVGCDVWDFEAAVARRDWEDADRLYTGPLLDGVFLSDAPEFEHWADGERARLADMHSRALESLAVERGERGDWLGAVELWRKRATADPHNARVALRLMDALDAAGDRASALKHAAVHGALLDSELGAAPDPAVVALAEQLRRDPTQRAPGDTRDHAVAQVHDTSKQAPSDEQHASVWRVGRRAIYAALAAIAAIALATTGLIRTHLLGVGDDSSLNRIAILPFRTSGADASLSGLRDGLVELLSLEFTGDVGPAAVDAGETLRAWQRDDDSEEPITPAHALRVARKLRAGQVAYGAVVGTPRRFTVTVSVLRVSDGTTRISPVQVSGTMDSLPAVIAALSAKLLARRAGTWRLSANDPDHTSTEVLRAYLRGMVAYRKASWTDAGTELFHAIDLDPTFVPAAYRFALIHAIVAPTTPLGAPPTRDPRFTQLYLRLWNDRQRLSAEHRMLLEAIADSLYVLWRMQALSRLERVVSLVPGSVEAWDILGDDYYHAGALTGRDGWAERAKRAFLRARELDSTIAVNARVHLADLAFIERDVHAHEQLASAANGPRGPKYFGYQSALLRGSQVAIHAARIDYANAWARGDEDGLDWAFEGLTLPQHELDSLIGQVKSGATTDKQLRVITEWEVRAAFMGGRPAAAAEALRRYYGSDSASLYAEIIDYALGDSVAAERVAGAVSIEGKRQVHPYSCNVALSRLRRGDSTGAQAILATEPALDDRLGAAAVVLTVRRGLVAQAAICGQVLRGVLASHAPTASALSDWLLFRADSIMRVTRLNYADFWNYDLALALARRGAYAAAASAARRHFVDLLPLPRLVIALREEGRWAVSAGDTAAALRAYRHYLLWRESPESSLVPQRDSVRAELAALERRAGIAIVHDTAHTLAAEPGHLHRARSLIRALRED